MTRADYTDVRVELQILIRVREATELNICNNKSVTGMSYGNGRTLSAAFWRQLLILFVDYECIRPFPEAFSVESLALVGLFSHVMDRRILTFCSTPTSPIMIS